MTIGISGPEQEGTRAKRRGGIHRRGQHRRNWSDPVRCRGRHPGRLDVVRLDQATSGSSGPRSARKPPSSSLFSRRPPPSCGQTRALHLASPGAEAGCPRPSTRRLRPPRRCPDPLEFLRERLPWRIVIAASSGLFALFVAWGKSATGALFCASSIRCPTARTIPCSTRISASTSFLCPPLSRSRIGHC